jgi:hypothetical protein
VFIVDVSFLDAGGGDESARQFDCRKARGRDYLENRCDVLLRNEEVLRRLRAQG